MYRRPQWLAVAVALIVVVFFFVLGNQFSLFAPAEPQEATVAQSNQNKNMQETNSQSDQAQYPAGLGVVDEKVGSGESAKAGDTVTVNYTGKFTDGKVFDSSIPRGEPFTFTLGAKQVIEGWDYGVAGMKVGGKRILTVPPALGYGANAIGPIPANSTLVFEVELLGIK